MMKEGEIFLTIRELCGYSANGVESIYIPCNKIITFVRDSHNSSVFNVDGREIHILHGPATEGSMRSLPYPLEVPSTIPEYQRLFRQLIYEMQSKLGVQGVSVEADYFVAKIHINGGQVDE